MKFIIDMPASWKPAMCPDCHIQYSGVNGICGLAVCPLANAKEVTAVEVIKSGEGYYSHAITGRKETLYAIKETK